MNDYTNFNSYSHGDLHKMVHALDSGGVMSASDPWRRAADTLKQIRTALDTAAGEASSNWEGSTSNAFYSKMTKLANSVNNVSAYANDAAITLEMMSQAIDQAKHDMPEEPGFWDKVENAVSDTAKSTIGINNDDTNISIADQRKAKAVGVMELLATKYRAASAGLKPPPIGSGVESVEDVPPPSDPSGAAAIGALIMGGGMGFAGAHTTAGTTTSPRSRGVVVEQAPRSPKLVAKAPTDAGIKGGTANPVPRPQAAGSVGPGTGIDGVGVGAPIGSANGSVASVGSGDGSGSGEVVGSGGLGAGTGLGGNSGRRGAAGRAGAFGADEIPSGPGGKAGAGRSGRRTFTEGGSGLGRGRGQGFQDQGMLGGTQAKKKDKKKGSERPDYLVEDEETWVSGKPTNPNVVE